MRGASGCWGGEAAEKISGSPGLDRGEGRGSGGSEGSAASAASRGASAERTGPPGRGARTGGSGCGGGRAEGTLGNGSRGPRGGAPGAGRHQERLKEEEGGGEAP